MALRAIHVRAVFFAGSALVGVACGGSTAATAAREAGTDSTDSRDSGSPGALLDDAGLTDATASASPDSEAPPDIQIDDAGVFVLATVPYPGVSSFAIDGTSLYWTSAFTGDDGGISPRNGTVSKCPLGGCSGAPTVLATGQAFPDGLVVSGPSLYWIDSNVPSIMRCSVDCNDDAATFYSWSTIGSGAAFALNATTVFLSGTSGVSLVQECPLSGCVSPTTFAAGQATPNDLAIDGANLVWIDYGTQTGGKTVGYIDGSVKACPASGCDDGGTTLASGLSYPGSLAVSGATAYWAEGDSVVACEVTGCNGAPTTIVSIPSNENGVYAVTVDATDVYFGSRGPAWKVWRCALGGCPAGPTLLSSTGYFSGGPVGEIAVDATRVYFVSGDNLQILAMAK